MLVGMLYMLSVVGTLNIEYLMSYDLQWKSSVGFG